MTSRVRRPARMLSSTLFQRGASGAYQTGCVAVPCGTDANRRAWRPTQL